MEGIQSLTPQPEDPERSLDPASEEDPDIKVELIDGVFHQLSMDNALVAITADYPGLFPASQVTTTEVLTPSFDPRSILTIPYCWCIAGGAFKVGSRTRGGRPTRVSPAQQAEEECNAN